MAYISNVTTHKSNVANAAANGLRGWFAALVQRMTDNRMFARTLRELGSLSDRELADLGLSRSSLRDVAHQAVYKN